VERAAGELIALPGPRYQRRHRRGHDISRQCGIGAGDYVDHDGHRIAPIIGRTMRRRHGGRRARVRGTTKVAADFSLLAAAVNLARLGVLGRRRAAGPGWQVAPI
jgi:hypothetical protein